MKNRLAGLWIVLFVYMGIGIIFYPKVGLIALICMFAPIVSAPFRGRKWCGSFCPRGSFLDKLISKISLSRSIPGFMMSGRFRWSIFLLLMGVFAFRISKAWGDWNEVGLVILTMVLLTTIMAAVVGIIYKPRTWCTAFCPMGTLAAVLSTSEGGIIFGEGCVSCQLCSKACPMQINPAQFKKRGQVTDPRCIRCTECIAACPKQVLSHRSADHHHLKKVS
ncbi:MAG: 4Fe-4S binding protein [Peptococcaceae bacterium]